jgi:hypothetical protein
LRLAGLSIIAPRISCTFFKAFGRLTITVVCVLGCFVANVLADLIGWTNRQRALIAVLATVAIAALTYEYATYAKAPWRTMQQQLELSERPWVGVGGPVEILKQLTYDTTMVTKVCVTNAGHSAALDTTSLVILTPAEPVRPTGPTQVTTNFDCTQLWPQSQWLKKQFPGAVTLGEAHIAIFPRSQLCQEVPAMLVTASATPIARSWSTISSAVSMVST